MSGKKSKLLIAQRALSDIAEIEAHSIAEWGAQLAARYVEPLERGRVRYDRNLGRVFVDWIDVRVAMVRDGVAWHYRYLDKPSFRRKRKRATH